MGIITQGLLYLETLKLSAFKVFENLNWKQQQKKKINSEFQYLLTTYGT